MEPFYASWQAMADAREAYLAASPAWVQTWMGWMSFAFVSSLWFALARAEARWVLLVGIATVPVSNVILYLFGVSRIWGLGHILLWTPLLIYLIKRRPGFDHRSAFSVWLHALMATVAISLAFNAVDVARWALGDG